MAQTAMLQPIPIIIIMFFMVLPSYGSVGEGMTGPCAHRTIDRQSFASSDSLKIGLEPHAIGTSVGDIYQITWGSTVRLASARSWLNGTIHPPIDWSHPFCRRNAFGLSP